MSDQTTIPHDQQELLEALEKELSLPVPPPPPPTCTGESFQALIQHNNNPVYPDD